MKIAITATGNNLSAKVDPRFGRAQNFIIIDTETMEFEHIENTGMNAAHGAGIVSGQLMSEKGVVALITGNVGPNAHLTLSAAKIKMYQCVDITVEQAVAKFKNNELKEITTAGPAHAGGGAVCRGCTAQRHRYARRHTGLQGANRSHRCGLSVPHDLFAAPPPGSSHGSSPRKNRLARRQTL